MHTCSLHKSGAKLRAAHLYFKPFVEDIAVRMARILTLITALGLALLFTGCATTPPLDKRKQERYAAYTGLSQEMRAMVDMGQVAIGMPMDAVYIAWGPPSQTGTAQSSDGQTTTTWIYTGTAWQEYRYWSHRYHPYGYGRYGHAYYPMPSLEFDYIPRSYVSAEVVFENGVVKSWRTFSQPPTR
jgi:hypothetical protein